MKLRFDKNSVRLRVRKSDLKLLGEQGFVKEAIKFGKKTTFTYQLIMDDQVGELVATLKNNILSISLPKTMAAEWAQSNRVAIEQHIKINTNEMLLVLIEKDFPCEHKEENMEDTFFELAEAKAVC
jgi:hypothetical protein